jgi:S-adenosylmethionine hydrolase
VRPVIALLTDFGTVDHYVGTMKGVMVGICGDVTLVDISHEIPAHDVLAGALELAAACRYFPAGTVFLAVVDPGVGSARRGIAVEAGGHRFVAPDNGLLTAALEPLPLKRAVELTDSRVRPPDASRTFEGRDRFAPAAAWLAKGSDLDELGPRIDDLHRLMLPRASMSISGIQGEVVRVDRFGNLITNIDRALYDTAAGRGPVDVMVGPHRVHRVVATYADAGEGELCALFGSSNHLEVAARGASAAFLLGAGRGAAVHVGRRA